MFTAWNSRRMDLLKRSLGTLPKYFMPCFSFGIVKTGGEESYHHYNKGDVVRIVNIENNDSVFCKKERLTQYIKMKDLILC